MSRNVISDFTPWYEKVFSLKKFVRKTNQIVFTKIRDKRYPEIPVKDFRFFTHQPDWGVFLQKMKVDNKSFSETSEFIEYAKKQKKIQIRFAGLRFKAETKILKRGLLGIPIREELILKKKKIEDPSFVVILAYVGDKIWGNVTLTLKAMGMLLSGKISASDSLGGPIEIAKQAGDSLELGIKSFFEFMAYISIILMFMNLLPLPVVDGGHIVFFLLEAVRGKPLPVNVMESILKIGFLFLLSLGIFVMINDTIRNFFQ